ncbi:MAG: radical SAM protein [Thermodesulfobacteriota bacterium]|nr:radical SAM protein [Thermodesulfobacteriota bacterium]
MAPPTSLSPSGIGSIVAGLCRGRLPGQVIVQITDRCNATCPHCGMRRTNQFSRSDLPVDDIRRIIDAAAEKGAAALSFTGGEPLLRLDDLVAMINHAGAAGIPLVRTGTNGFFMKFNGQAPERFKDRVKAMVEKLAATPLRNFWISIDSSVPEIHEGMRGLAGVVRGIEAALPIFHDAGIYPAVNLGVNRNVGGALTARLDRRDFATETDYLAAFYRLYSEGIGRFYRQVINMGFTMLNTCYPMSVNEGDAGDMQAVYAATATDRIVKFSQAEKAVLFRVLIEKVEQYRSRIRIFSPLTSLYTLYREYAGMLPDKHPAAGCRGGIDFFFVDARSGNAYPCGYRGDESLGKYWEIQQKQLDRRAVCRRCDWECFRDPSEQFAPLMRAFDAPFRSVHRFFTDRQYLRYWRADLQYYHACEFFDGRKPPQYPRIAEYKTTGVQRRAMPPTGRPQHSMC